MRRKFIGGREPSVARLGLLGPPDMCPTARGRTCAPFCQRVEQLLVSLIRVLAMDIVPSLSYTSLSEAKLIDSMKQKAEKIDRKVVIVCYLELKNL